MDDDGSALSAPAALAALAALAAEDQPQALLEALAAEVQASVGARLFTIMTVDREAGLCRRIYSSDPVAYPVAGAKPLLPGAWASRVIDDKLLFVANSIAEIAAVFEDHPQILALGCESCINVPVVYAGSVIGTLNLLHAAGYYTPERQARAMGLRLLAGLALLAERETAAKARP